MDPLGHLLAGFTVQVKVHQYKVEAPLPQALNGLVPCLDRLHIDTKRSQVTLNNFAVQGHIVDHQRG